MTVLRPNQTLVSENENDRKNRIFGFSQQITPDVSTTFTSFTTFVCSPPLDFLSHARPPRKMARVRDVFDFFPVFSTRNIIAYHFLQLSFLAPLWIR